MDGGETEREREILQYNVPLHCHPEMYCATQENSFFIISRILSAINLLTLNDVCSPCNALRGVR